MVGLGDALIVVYAGAVARTTGFASTTQNRLRVPVVPLLVVYLIRAWVSTVIYLKPSGFSAVMSEQKYTACAMVDFVYNSQW